MASELSIPSYPAGNGSADMTESAPVTPGASLMLSFRPAGRKVLVLGTKRLAASRISALLEADAFPVVVGVDIDESLGESELQEAVRRGLASEKVLYHTNQGHCQYLPAPPKDTEDEWVRLIDSVDGVNRDLFSVCICDTLHAGDEEETNVVSPVGRLLPVARARLVANLCRARRIPVNVVDRPGLCDFSFPASHRFVASALETIDQDGSANEHSRRQVPSSLQIAVTTNGKGCRLAGRIRRDIIASLPKNVGDAVERVGMMRDMARMDDIRGRGKDDDRIAKSRNIALREPSMRRQALHRTVSSTEGASHATRSLDAEEDDLAFDSTPLNSPVPQLHSPSEFDFRNYAQNDGENADGAAAILQRQRDEMIEERRRRMRWVAQMSEYWPITYLGNISGKDMKQMLETYRDTSSASDDRGRSLQDNTSLGKQPENYQRSSSQHSLSLKQPLGTQHNKGQIFLVGSGPGHPGLLTAMALELLTSEETDLILSDKLVPSQILALIPSSTPLRIARKFPGNAEGAQSELIALALEAAHQGKRVIRLKQGDPFVYGRGGEEVLAFRKESIETVIVPGISSALAAPLLLRIPVTQRGAADSMALCTGVGRGGKSVALPGYERGRSLVVLMGVARLPEVVKTLCHGWRSNLGEKHAAHHGSVAGVRKGAPFPPYTPIAIIERASSSDQRLVASTLENIETSLELVGEQRPPGMMLIGWAVLSLDGEGHVDILDDETQCGDDIAELERRDRKRVVSWLPATGYIVREGLDEAYASASQPSTRQHRHAIEQKGSTGWAAPRYGERGVPRGGWGPNEQHLDSVDTTSIT